MDKIKDTKSGLNAQKSMVDVQSCFYLPVGHWCSYFSCSSLTLVVCICTKQLRKLAVVNSRGSSDTK